MKFSDRKHFGNKSKRGHAYLGSSTCTHEYNNVVRQLLGTGHIMIFIPTAGYNDASNGQQLCVSCASGEESTSLWKFCFQRRERGVGPQKWIQWYRRLQQWTRIQWYRHLQQWTWIQWCRCLQISGTWHSDDAVCQWSLGGIVFHCLSSSVSCHAFPLFGKLLFNQKPHDL